jgi:hypothetical protein
MHSFIILLQLNDFFFKLKDTWEICFNIFETVSFLDLKSGRYVFLLKTLENYSTQLFNGVFNFLRFLLILFIIH